MAKLLRVGSQTYDLGPAGIIDGLFATITYRLERDGRGTHFPVVMNRLYAGRMSPSDAAAASHELHEIENALASLAPDQVVWGLSDLRRRDDRRLPVNRAARNVRDYFVASGGRPLLTTLQEAVQFSRLRNQPLVLASSEAVRHSRASLFLLIAGLLWTVLGYVFCRDWVLSPHGSDSHAGPLIWPAGVFIFIAGLGNALTARYPSFDDWYRRHAWLNFIVTFLGLGLYVLLGLLLRSR